MNNSKFYSFETLSPVIKDSLTQFLKLCNIYYELSGCGTGWHFEVKCTKQQLMNVNRYLDTLEDFEEA